MPLTVADANRYRIETRLVRRALAQPLHTGGGRTIAVRESVLLKVTSLTSDGLAGYGEAAPLLWFGTETAAEVADALAALGSGITISRQHDAESPWGDSLETVLEQKAAHRLHRAPCARWALESALRQAGALPPCESTTQPDCQPHNTAPHNTATCSSQHAVPRTLPVAALLTSGCATLPQPLLDAGFNTFKLKIGVRPAKDEIPAVLRLLDTLRAPLATRHSHNENAGKNGTQPPSLKLRLDANGSLGGAALQQWLYALEPFAAQVDFIEQPFANGCEAQTADAFAGSLLRFAFDESLTALPHFIETAAAFPQAVLVIKPSLLGSAEGFLRWRQQDAQAATPRHIVYSSALETGIGVAHALALAAADPVPQQPAGFGTGKLFAADGLGAPPQNTATMPAPATVGNCPQAHALRTEMEAIWTRA